MDEKRTARVSEAIREELLEIIGFEMADPRLAGLQISGVEVSADGRHASVCVAAGPDPRERKHALDALARAEGFLRHQLASRLDLRLVPELRFSVDKHPDTDGRIDLLLKRAGKRRGAA